LYRDADDLAAETHGGAIDDAPGELSAGGVDVVAAGAANGRQQAPLQRSSRKRWMTGAGERR